MSAQKQQGDVLFLRVKGLPKGATPINAVNNKYVLVEGETTGHAHCVCSEDVQLHESNGVLYMSVEAPSTVTHEEHGDVVIEEGVWEVGRVAEVDPFQREIRSVSD